MVVAVDLGPVNAEIQRLIAVELIVGSAIVLVLAVVGVGLVRANLRPLDDIEMIAGEIAKGHLDHRVPEGDPRTEVGSLGRSLNAMLAQIERAFHAQGQAEKAAHESEERMRRFVADAAHELRTPLTTIRGFAAHYRQRGGASRLRTGATVPTPSFRTDAVSSELADHSPDAESSSMEGLSPEELDRLMSRVESEATRMGVLVEDLLTLARLDQQRPLNLAPVDLLTLAADAVQDARVVSPGRPIDLIVAPGTAFLVDGDEPRLRQVLANLVNNAITHTPDGTPIRVKIGRGTLEAHKVNGTGGPAGAPETAAQGEWGGLAGAGVATVPVGTDEPVVPAVVLDVEDDGPGMTANQAQRVFERFYRADAARNRASGGTGLGLAIVAGLVSAHGGTVSVRTAPGKGADFQVKLPLSPDALPDDDADDDLPA
jgi:two-component system OmpR family sensor kinase